MSCVAPGCKTGYGPKKKYPPGVGAHRFPKDPKMRRLWIEAIPRTKWEPAPAARICSLHFSKEDFEDRRSDQNSHRTELRGELKRMRLKPHAIPHVFASTKKETGNPYPGPMSDPTRSCSSLNSDARDFPVQENSDNESEVGHEMIDGWMAPQVEQIEILDDSMGDEKTIEEPKNVLQPKPAGCSKTEQETGASNSVPPLSPEEGHNMQPSNDINEPDDIQESVPEKQRLIFLAKDPCILPYIQQLQKGQPKNPAPAQVGPMTNLGPSKPLKISGHSIPASIISNVQPMPKITANLFTCSVCRKAFHRGPSPKSNLNQKHEEGILDLSEAEASTKSNETNDQNDAIDMVDLTEDLELNEDIEEDKENIVGSRSIGIQCELMPVWPPCSQPWSRNVPTRNKGRCKECGQNVPDDPYMCEECETSLDIDKNTIQLPFTSKMLQLQNGKDGQQQLVLLKVVPDNHQQGVFQCPDCSLRFPTHGGLLTHASLVHFKTFPTHAERTRLPSQNIYINITTDDEQLNKQKAIDANQRPETDRIYQMHTDSLQALGKEIVAKKSLNLPGDHTKNPFPENPIQLSNILPYQLLKETNLAERITEANLQKNYSCDTCNISFSMEVGLYRHIYEIHPDAKIKCKKCDDEFKYIRDYKYHMSLVHTKKTNHRPEIKKRALQDSVVGEPNIPSKKCHKSIVPKRKKHMGRKFCCNVCKKQFKGGNIFRKHVKRCKSNLVVRDKLLEEPSPSAKTSTSQTAKTDVKRYQSNLDRVLSEEPSPGKGANAKNAASAKTLTSQTPKTYVKMYKSILVEKDELSEETLSGNGATTKKAASAKTSTSQTTKTDVKRYQSILERVLSEEPLPSKGASAKNVTSAKISSQTPKTDLKRYKSVLVEKDEFSEDPSPGNGASAKNAASAKTSTSQTTNTDVKRYQSNLERVLSEEPLPGKGANAKNAASAKTSTSQTTNTDVKRYQSNSERVLSEEPSPSKGATDKNAASAKTSSSQTAKTDVKRYKYILVENDESLDEPSPGKGATTKNAASAKTSTSQTAEIKEKTVIKKAKSDIPKLQNAKERKSKKYKSKDAEKNPDWNKILTIFKKNDDDDDGDEKTSKSAADA